MDHLAETILERDKSFDAFRLLRMVSEVEPERGRRRTHSGTPRTSDEVAAQKRPAQKGRTSAFHFKEGPAQKGRTSAFHFKEGPAQKGRPIFGLLLRCSSSTCRRGHAFVVAPYIRLKSGPPNVPIIYRRLSKAPFHG